MIGNYIGTVCVDDIELVEQHLTRTHILLMMMMMMTENPRSALDGLRECECRVR